MDDMGATSRGEDEPADAGHASGPEAVGGRALADRGTGLAEALEEAGLRLDRRAADALAELAASLPDLRTGAVMPGGSSADSRPDGLEASALAAARVVWSTLVEPGDRVAGELIALAGPARALGLAMAGAAAEHPHDGAAIAAGGLARSGVAAPIPLLAELPEALERWRPRLDLARAARAASAGRALGARLLLPEDAAWPALVDDLGEHAPVALWARGEPAILRAPGGALVGSRASTPYGEGVAAELAAGLVERGCSVVSGGAYGIDGAAHRTALALGGLTVAVMAGGPDRLYPSGHTELLERIVDEGCLLAELPPGQAPTRWRFLQRNRIVAALSATTVVVEAGHRSGALSTANHASAIGRPLGAVPGPVTSQASAGCHRIIRESGAELVTSPAELAELMGGEAAVAEAVRAWRHEASTSARAFGDGGASAARAGLAGGLAAGLADEAWSGATTGEDGPVGAGGRWIQAPLDGFGADGVARPAGAVRPLRAEERRALDALRASRAAPLESVAAAAGLGIGECSAALAGLELDGLAVRTAGGWKAAKGAKRGSRSAA